VDRPLTTPNRVSALFRTPSEYRADINGLRALAVLGVVVFHADRTLLPGGFAGVDVFFVISGFLISRIILSECASNHFSLPLFYAKRAKRILPALLIVLAFVWIAGWFWADPEQFREIGGHLIGNSYFTLNFWLFRDASHGGYFAPDVASKPLLHLWSLSIEEQFYLIWPAFLLILFRLKDSILPAAILAVFAVSLTICLVLTTRDPTAAFYLPWGRAWELAGGALLAYRETFLLRLIPFAPRRIANVGAGLGVLLIFAAFLALSESQPFPGWRALIPTAGCALVIAHPRSLWGETLLANRAATFFGLISYPLYLWHWPLFAYAHIAPGVTPTRPVMFGLAALAVLLATLTYRLVELPLASFVRGHKRITALTLIAGLAATGLLGRETTGANGFPGRFPPLVTKIFTYHASGANVEPLWDCFYDRDPRQRTLDEERERARQYYAAHKCAVVADPTKPTIMIVGDSHAAHLFAGLKRRYGDAANLVAMPATYCEPLDLRQSQTPRCLAINEVVVDTIRSIKPTVLLLGYHFAALANDRGGGYSAYLDELGGRLRELHAAGVPAIVIAGQVPTWSPWLPILVGRDVLNERGTPEFSTYGVREDSLAVDRELKRRDWGDGVVYVSQAEKLCGAGGCRRTVGSVLPDDMLAIDYGHYSLSGSVFAVETIFAPAIDAALARALSR
jgi:peptidoglycan/LPS O-acetylase OafA/YrhL